MATFEQLVAEAQALKLKGWDFSAVHGRWHEEKPPWDYRTIVQEQMQGVTSLLDMGTGGGEFLSSLQPLPPHTRATEGWPPNLPIARQRLEPLGVEVYPFTADNDLPFADGEFELIINRHESYDPAELTRILRPGGRFLTQQVGNLDNLRLNELLGAGPPEDYGEWHATLVAEQLRAAGFTIVDVKEAYSQTRFDDVGVIIFYLNNIPWQVPRFSVEKYRPALEAIHEHIQTHGALVTTSHRFLVEVVWQPG